MISFFAVLIGCVLDYIFGDPERFPHYIIWIGNLISFLEKHIRGMFRKTPRGELAGGFLLVILVILISAAPVWGVLYLLNMVHPLLRLALESVICWQSLAARSLSDAGLRVFKELQNYNLPGARYAVGMIVGRDTTALDEAGVTRATVETIAENTSDGVIAPLLYLLVGGGTLGVLYKAVNTMDSMIGYKNDKYLYFGRVAAKLDDVLNFLPARISGLLMVPGAFFAGLNVKNAWHIFLRDRKNHTSPNSAHTESAAAGALGIQLGGDNYYFGKLVHKPTIGDPLKPIEPSDIPSTINLMFCTSILCLITYILIGGIVILWL